MSGTYSVVMGDRGRLGVPAELRERLHWATGSSLLLVETPRGVIVATRDQVKEIVRDGLAGVDLVAELLADRRKAAAAEDAA